MPSWEAPGHEGAPSTFHSLLCRRESDSRRGHSRGPWLPPQDLCTCCSGCRAECLPQRLPCPPLLPPDSHPHPAAFCPPFPASLQFPKISYNLLIHPIYVCPSPFLLSTASLHALSIQ